MKKWITTFFLIAIFLVIVACSSNNVTQSNEETPEINNESNGEVTELSFWTFTDGPRRIFEQAAERWNKEFPDRPIKFNAEIFPYDQMHNNLLLALQSGTGAPDIADIELNRFPNFLQGEPQLEPLNEYVEPLLDKFVKSRLDIYAKDGNYYGLPTHVGASVMYYNTEIMAEAGIDIDSIKSWDDYVEAGKKVVANTDAKMITVETDDIYGYWSMISQQDSDFMDEDGNAILDNEVNVKTLQFLHDLIYEHGIADITPGGNNHSEEFKAFMIDGGQASVLMPMWFMFTFEKDMADLKGKLAIRPLPYWEEGGKRSAGMGGTGTVVPSQSQNKELAKEFIAYAKLSEEGNISLWTELGFDPPRWDVWESPEIQASNKYFDFFGDDIFDTLLEIREEINPVNIKEKTPDVNEQLTTHVLNNVIRQQSQSPEEALKQATETVNNN